MEIKLPNHQPTSDFALLMNCAGFSVRRRDDRSCCFLRQESLLHIVSPHPGTAGGIPWVGPSTPHAGGGGGGVAILLVASG